ncbi:hypothetical protein OROHE_014140 [Orobanche hederae]
MALDRAKPNFEESKKTAQIRSFKRLVVSAMGVAVSVRDEITSNRKDS